MEVRPVVDLIWSFSPSFFMSPSRVMNHSVSVGTASWHLSRYIYNREPGFDWAVNLLRLSPSHTHTT